jgi:hypothetical protein
MINNCSQLVLAIAVASGIACSCGKLDSGGQGGSDTTDAGSDTTDAGSDTTDAGSDTTDAGSDTTDAGSDTTDAGSDTTDGDPEPPANLNLILTAAITGHFAGGPDYGFELAPSVTGTETSYTLNAPAGKVALTEWHEVAVTQAPANCASDSDIVANWSAGSKNFVFAIATEKVTGNVGCTVTVTASTGEPVTWTWVYTLLNSGQDTPYTDQGGNFTKTGSCGGCHGSSASGGYNMRLIPETNATDANVRYDAVVGEKERQGDSYADGATSQLIWSATVLSGTCTPPAATSTKRVDKGNPYESTIVTLTRPSFADGVGSTVDHEGKTAYQCDSSNNYTAIYMPKGRVEPQAGLATNTKTALTPELHKKLARWVLQGAQGPE